MILEVVHLHCSPFVSTIFVSSSLILLSGILFLFTYLCILFFYLCLKNSLVLISLIYCASIYDWEPIPLQRRPRKAFIFYSSNVMTLLGRRYGFPNDNLHIKHGDSTIFSHCELNML
nr:hypothetical protein Iba_chr04aCG6930 [Ipomoea batatas]GMC85822.1 hypothetical protein Iba_chr04dCG5030 [Ipomoea batatas]